MAAMAVPGQVLVLAKTAHLLSCWTVNLLDALRALWAAMVAIGQFFNWLLSLLS
jgi:hypothetical protein